MCLRFAWCDTLPAAKLRKPMRPIHSSERVAASKNPHALGIAVSTAVIEFVMVKRGDNGMAIVFLGKRSCRRC